MIKTNVILICVCFSLSCYSQSNGLRIKSIADTSYYVKDCYCTSYMLSSKVVNYQCYKINDSSLYSSFSTYKGKLFSVINLYKNGKIIKSDSSFYFKYNPLNIKKTKKGDILIDGHLGLALFSSGIFSYKMSPSGKDSVTERNPLFIGGRVEYMIKNNTGLQLEYSNSSSNFDFIADSGKHYNGTLSKTRILLKFNFYESRKSNRLYTYSTLGMGYKFFKIHTNAPQQPQETFLLGDLLAIFASILFLSPDPNPQTRNPFRPVALRVGYGMRYFFTDHIALNLEAGLGGPLLQGGLTFRL